jgi:hypothetical protein
MPYTDRAPHYRRRPLGDHADVLVFPVSDECDTKVYARPGCVLFIEEMWHGDYQQIPVDPDQIDNLIEALGEAKAYLADARASEDKLP